MADPEPTQVRINEMITITILRTRDLRGQRGETVTALVRVEFGDKILGESSKEDCSPSQPAEFNYSATINVTFDDPFTLDEISTKPILLTFIEVLPKEKKQKEEKTVTLGQCTVDLLPFIQGELKYTSTLVINPIPGSPLDSITPEQAKPEVDLRLSVESTLLTEAQLKECNIMSMTVESLFSPPEAFTLVGVQYLYTATMPMPITSEKESTIVFVGGQLKPGVEKEVPNKQKRWALPGSAVGSAVYIQDRILATDPIDEEDGDFKGKNYRDHRVLSEQEKNRVTWNIERRCFMDGSGSRSFQDKIAKTRYWPIEIYRTSFPSGAKGKKDDDNHITFHGIAYVNLAPLLYPGVKRIRGAYRVIAYNEQELTEKTNRKGSLADEALKVANGILGRTSNSPFPKPGKPAKDEVKAKEVKKGVAVPGTQGASDVASEADGTQMVNAEGQLYTESSSYIMLEISLLRPLVPKRQLEELAKRVAEYIPPRPIFPKRTDGAERAINDYHVQVANVTSLILDEFRETFGESPISGTTANISEEMDERRQKLIYQLNSSGKYFAFKEQLKHSVVKIVREKYLKTSNFKNKEELQMFLSELYIYLVDQMHVGLNKVLAIEDQSPIPEPLTDMAQLKHFAREAEVNNDFELASKYYQERIARDRNDPDHWFDFGTFCLYLNDFTKAEECFKECVSIDQRHIGGLLMCGVVSTMQDKNEMAEIFFETATSIEPKNILTWTALGLFYNSIGNDIGTEMALMESNKLNMAIAVAAATALREQEQRERDRLIAQEVALVDGDMVSPLVGDTNTGPSDGASKDGTSVDIHITKPVETPISVAGSDKKTKTRSSSPPKHKIVLESTAESADAQTITAVKQDKAVIDPQSDKANSSRGRFIDNLVSRPPSLSMPGGENGSEADRMPPREATPVPSSTIFMQAIDFLLEVKAMPFAERALAHHLLDPLGGQSASYFIARARLELLKQQLDEADQSLQEALHYDHQNPDAWAILGHVKFLKGETEIAKDCYERTLAFVADATEMHSIYLRLASIYLIDKQFDKAKRQFLLACKRTPSCVSWLGVGIACYRLGELSNAEDALAEANILNNVEPKVWGYLSLVCLHTGRQLEAEQAYKYAIKLKLQEQDLLDEIHSMQEKVGFGNPQM